MSGDSPAALIGRDRELAALMAALGAARERRGALIAITGDPGIGKTRLAEELTALAADAGVATAWGAAWPGDGAPPLWPWHELLTGLGTPNADDLLRLHEPGDVERFVRFRAVGAELTRLASQRPTLLVLDDLHAVDPAAALLARFVGRSLRRAALLMVVTCREQPAEAHGSEVRAVLDDSVLVELRGLTGSDLTRLAEQCNPGSEAPDPASLAQLTGGNPLLVREAVSGGAAPGALPRRVRALLGLRLSALEAGHRSVLAAAAVLGPDADDAAVAAVADVHVEVVVAARQQARRVGVLAPELWTGFEFAHALMRSAVLDDAGERETAELHASAAEVLRDGTDPTGVRRRAQIAHHLLIAARAGAAPVAAAVAAARSAAETERAEGAHEQAARLLRDAVALYTEPSEVPARLWIELAQSELSGGRLKAAREPFRCALDATDAAPPDVAEAAIGLGGIWVFEQRDVAEAQRYLAVLDSAHTAVERARPDLAARLRVRLAAERVYLATGTSDAVGRGVDEIRRRGDAHDLSEALSLYNHVLLSPHDALRRRGAVDELVHVAGDTGDTVPILMSALWRTVDEFLLGRPGAERTLAELRQRADALRVEAVLYIVELIDVMLAVRAGRLEAAEQQSLRCAERGMAVGDADAAGYFGAQLLSIRWLQGRSDEVLPMARELAAAPTAVAAHPVYPAAVAALAADAGPATHEEARRQLHTLDIAAIAPSSNWLLILACLVEAAAETGDAATAAAAYDALLPFADLPVLASLAVACFGSVERSLGLAARVLGRLDDAVDHLERAVIANRRLGHWPLLALSRGDLANVLLLRSRGRDVAHAAALLTEACTALDDMGLSARADRYRQAGAALSSVGTMRRLGPTWELAVEGWRCVVPDGLGVRYLARLLSTPGSDVPADELAGTATAGYSRQPLLDDTARRQYRERVNQLQLELDAADASGDVELAARAQLELDTLVAELAAVSGLGGRDRAFADPRERSRTAVQKAIRRAISAITATAPELGSALRASVQTGLTCRYQPTNGAPLTWQIAAETAPRA